MIQQKIFIEKNDMKRKSIKNQKALLIIKIECGFHSISQYGREGREKL